MTDIYLGKGYFFFAQLCPVVARTWFRLRSESFFLGPKIRILAQKSVFFYKTLDFVNGPFVDLAETIDLVPSDWFFDFWFPRKGPFCKKNGWRTKKSSPTPLWGHCLPVTALALLARRLDNAILPLFELITQLRTCLCILLSSPLHWDFFLVYLFQEHFLINSIALI